MNKVAHVPAPAVSIGRLAEFLCILYAPSKVHTPDEMASAFSVLDPSSIPWLLCTRLLLLLLPAGCLPGHLNIAALCACTLATGTGRVKADLLRYVLTTHAEKMRCFPNLLVHARA